MKFIIGNSYIINVEINNAVLTYHCTITEDDEIFVAFLDKFGKKFTYNKNTIKSVQEVKK